MPSFIDTHSHLYLSDFKDDIQEVIQRAQDSGIIAALLPNIDSDSTPDLLNLCRQYPHFCYPMLGLHPTSVKENFEKELLQIEELLGSQKCIAIGEIGIDLYWDTSFQKQQEATFGFQLELAKKHHLPVVIHTRNSMNEALRIIENHISPSLKGVFHCFSGTVADAQKVVDMGFYLGIGGVVTFKKSELPQIIESIDIEHLLLETDAPFLAPSPYRGKRNEPSYIPLIAQKIAEIKHTSMEKVAEVTTKSALTLFNI